MSLQAIKFVQKVFQGSLLSSDGYFVSGRSEGLVRKGKRSVYFILVTKEAHVTSGRFEGHSRRINERDTARMNE